MRKNEVWAERWLLLAIFVVGGLAVAIRPCNVPMASLGRPSAARGTAGAQRALPAPVVER